MTQELIEQTTREWVTSDTRRAAQELKRLAHGGTSQSPASAEELVQALIGLAGRLEVAANRLW